MNSIQIYQLLKWRFVVKYVSEEKVKTEIENFEASKADSQSIRGVEPNFPNVQ
jgi:hypothetical protein